MGLYISPRVVIAILAIFVLVAIIKWGLDSLGWLVSGRRAQKLDEERERKKLENMKVTHPVAQIVSDVTSPDGYIDGLIERGKLREAEAHVMEMRQIAMEMKDQDSLRNYDAYEKRIRQLQSKAKAGER